MRNKFGPAFDRGHRMHLQERVMPDGSGWVVTDAGRYFRPSRSSAELFRAADEQLQKELAGSVEFAREKRKQ